MLTDLKALLKDAREKRYAVPAFDVSNYEMIRAVIETCAEEKSPCIFMTLKPDLEGNGLKLLSNLMKTASEIYKDLPVCIHLDHATSFDDIKAAGKKINIWTVDDKAMGEQFAEWGADYLTTNILE